MNGKRVYSCLCFVLLKENNPIRFPIHRSSCCSCNVFRDVRLFCWRFFELQADAHFIFHTQISIYALCRVSHRVSKKILGRESQERTRLALSSYCFLRRHTPPNFTCMHPLHLVGCAYISHSRSVVLKLFGTGIHFSE